MAAGAHASCLALALEHARSRVLYGQPIAALEGVQQIVGRVFARFAESLALARRAARAAARWPASARAWTAAAKLVCPTLLEESVHEVGTLLGARSLMETLPFARVRRTAPVFAIFDGSSQLQLDELWRYAARWRLDGAVAAEEVWKAGRALREPAHCPFDANKEDDSGALDRVSPPAILGALNDAASGAALGVLAEAAQVVGRVAQGARSSGQATRFRISSGAASLYALAALAEAASLAEGDARDALRAALAVRISELAPRLAATLVALERQGGPGTAELASRVLALARDADSLTAAGHAAALRFT
jgi:hypothetical protein